MTKTAVYPHLKNCKNDKRWYYSASHRHKKQKAASDKRNKLTDIYTLCFKKVYQQTTNDNFNSICPILVIFGTHIME